MSSKKSLERKHKEEQEATAHAFQEFIQSFQDTSGLQKKTFIKSGILNTKTGQEIGAEINQLYNPQPIVKTSSVTTIRNAIECARILKDTKVIAKGQCKPKSNLELLKEELKLRHLERGERSRTKDYLPVQSSLDPMSSNDPTTTNLFVANINPKVTEQDLMQLFGSYGPLGSVKIMWPRTDEKNHSSTNCGFAAFMSRSDAELAMQELKNCEDMRIGWGKPVKLPGSPIYMPPQLLKLLLPPPNSGLPFNAQPINQPFETPTTEKDMQDLLYNSIVRVTIPLDKKVLMIVNRVIEFVIREGPLFEAMVMNREINNPSYQFLFDNRNFVHVYYRWKLFSLLHGESPKNWSTKEFRMFKNGSVWKPPIVPDYTKGMPANLVNSSLKLKKSLLSEAQQTRFVELLQGLNMSRKKVGEVMVFCLNHVDAAIDIVDIIVDSFNGKSTKPTKKIARLYLLSDVLYNSSMKNCFTQIYRTEFQKHLVDIFQQLHLTLTGLNLQFDKKAFECKTLSVLRSWDIWKIYPNEFLNSLLNAFLQTVKETQNSVVVDEWIDSANLIESRMEENSEVDEWFSVSLVKEEKEAEVVTSCVQLSNFVPSKWETVDPEQVEAQAMSTKRFYDLEIERQTKVESKQETASSEISECNRKALRKIEVMVLQYQEEFETGKRKLKRGKSLESETSNYRKHLLEKLSKENKSKKHSSSNDTSGDEREKKGRPSKRKSRKGFDSYKNRDNKKRFK